MNARLPNEWRNGLTVGMGIYAAFDKDRVVAVALLYSLLAQLVGKELRYTCLNYIRESKSKSSLKSNLEPCEY